MKKFTADFETATWLKDESFVWAWAVCEIGNEENIIIENNIDSFMKFLEKHSNTTFYFHNLKFDGEFIIYYLLTHGFKHIEKKSEADDKTFSTLISDMGMFYQITIYFKKRKKVKIIDSLKIIPFSVKEIAKAFDIPESKLELDYDTPRSKNHTLTQHEKDYIKNDVVIVAKALNVIFSEGLKKMTQGSNALFDYKEILTKRRFEHYFPQIPPDVDEDIRQAYKGGFTYLNPLYKDKEVKKGYVIDVNSLYPYCMTAYKLPYGEPIFFEGKYKEDKVYDLYIQAICVRFKLKKGKIPTIQVKNDRFNFKPTEYLETSGDKDVVLFLTNIDLALFLENYDIIYIEYMSGWKFKSVKGLFTDYVEKWTQRKIEASKEGNKGQRTLAKLMLNSLYGKFATSLKAQSKIPYLDNDIVKYKLSDVELKQGLYIPIGAFITSYARNLTIRTSMAIREYSLKKYGVDMYIYSDTDSCHTILPKED